MGDTHRAAARTGPNIAVTGNFYGIHIAVEQAILATIGFPSLAVVARYAVAGAEPEHPVLAARHRIDDAARQAILGGEAAPFFAIGVTKIRNSSSVYPNALWRRTTDE